MSSSEDARWTQLEIDKTNEQILRAREELFAMQNGDFSCIYKKRPQENFKIVGTDFLAKIFITRAFIHRIYGYPEFDNTIVDSFVSFTLKRGNRQIKKEIGQIVDIETSDELYCFQHNQCTINAAKRVLVAIPDGSKHLLPLYQISDKLPRRIEFEEYKSHCLKNKTPLPTEAVAEEKELEIIKTATRCLSDQERILVDAARTQRSETVQMLAKEKILARSTLQVAKASGHTRVQKAYELKLKKLNQKSSAIAKYRKPNLQEDIEKKLQSRHKEERIKELRLMGLNPPEVMQGIKRVHTIDSQIETSNRIKMSLLANKKIRESRVKHTLSQDYELPEIPTTEARINDPVNESASVGSPTSLSNHAVASSFSSESSKKPTGHPASKQNPKSIPVAPEVTLFDLFAFHEMADLEIQRSSQLSRSQNRRTGTGRKKFEKRS